MITGGLSLLGALEALGVGVLAAVVVRQVAGPAKVTVVGPDGKQLPALPAVSEVKALLPASPAPAKVSGADECSGVDGCGCVGCAACLAGGPEVDVDDLDGADGPGPSVSDDDAAEDELGAATAAQLRAKAARAKLAASARAKKAKRARRSVPRAQVQTADPGLDVDPGLDDIDPDLDVDDYLSGWAVPYRISTSRWALPIRAVDKGGVPGKLVLSGWAIPSRFVPSGGIPVHGVDAPAPPAPAPASSVPAAKVSGWADAAIAGWGDQLFEGLKTAGQGAASIFLGPEAGKAIGTLAETAKTAVDKETGHDPHAGRYSIDALHLPGSAPSAPPPAAPPSGAPTKPASGWSSAPPPARIIPEGATRGGPGRRQVMRSGAWVPAPEGTVRTMRDGSQSVLRSDQWVPLADAGDATTTKTTNSDAQAPAGA